MPEIFAALTLINGRLATIEKDIVFNRHKQEEEYDTVIAHIVAMQTKLTRLLDFFKDENGRVSRDV